MYILKKSSFIKGNLQHKIFGVYLASTVQVQYSASTEHVLLMGHLINEPTHIKYVLKKDYAIDNLQVFYLKATFLKISCHIPIC